MQHVVSGADATRQPDHLTAAAASSAPPPTPPKTVEKSSPAVDGFQELIDGPLAKYLGLSTELGGLIADQVTSHGGTSFSTGMH